MKKIFIEIGAVIFVCLILGGFLFANSSEIVDTSVSGSELSGNGIDYYFITHTMSKGETVELSLTKSIKHLSDDVYVCTFLVNQSENKNYDIKNIKLEFSVDDEADIVSCFYSGGGGIYESPLIFHLEDERKAFCDSDSNYLYCYVTVKNNSDEPLIVPEIDRFEYDIEGKFPYTINKFEKNAPLAEYIDTEA